MDLDMSHISLGFVPLHPCILCIDNGCLLSPRLGYNWLVLITNKTSLSWQRVCAHWLCKHGKICLTNGRVLKKNSGIGSNKFVCLREWCNSPLYHCWRGTIKTHYSSRWSRWFILVQMVSCNFLLTKLKPAQLVQNKLTYDKYPSAW